mgnify:CR=1 FL=1
MKCDNCGLKKGLADLVEVKNKRLCLKCYTAYKLKKGEWVKAIKVETPMDKIKLDQQIEALKSLLSVENSK